MGLVSTTFSITEKALPAGSGQALEDAIVRVFSEDGETFVTQGTTDSDGELVLELEDETTYWVRFFLVGYSFDSLLTIDVDSSESSNTFDVEGTYLLEHPPSANQYLCRATGYVRGADWHPKPGIRMTFSITGEPRVVAGGVMLPQDVIVESDAEGWIEVELVQGGAYDVVVTGMDDEVLRVKVPESQAISITELIWPYVVSYEFGESSVTLAVDEEVTVSAVMTLSSGVTTPFELDNDDRFVAGSWLDFEESTEGIVEITFDDDDNMVLTGQTAGTTTITPSVKDNVEASRLPTPTRSLGTLSVTVTG